jgi:hypothetical protein
LNNSPRERRQIQADGHVTMRGLLDRGEVARYRELVQAAVSKADRLVLAEPDDLYQRAFDQYMNLWQIDEEMSEITLNPDLARVAASLLDVAAVRVYHDQALIKLAGGGHTPWHQDHWYWPLDTDQVITMWLPLQDMDPQMGELVFAAGTNAGPIGDEPISVDSDRFYEDYLTNRSIRRTSTGPMRAGDASFHLGWTLHRASPNTTGRDREVMTVIWFADGARVTEPANAGQVDDLRRWLPDSRPGELAAGSLNPRLPQRATH